MADMTELCAFVAFGMLLRWTVSLNPYSGSGKPPMFGDYEAQRHWMEITYNLPMNQWYKNGTNNDLQYWGLDYPPLTAYHSWFAGAISHRINSSWVELRTSRGTESPAHKLFMRYTGADLLTYFPAALLYTYTQHTVGHKYLAVAGLVTYPGLILIDYGHFQYNCVSLGLALLAIALVCLQKDLWASVAFVLALNYKQMELYHALPFFCYLLGSCRPVLFRGLIKLFKLGLVVLATFALCWWPFLQNKWDALQVLSRLFPFSRGLYEDKVANVWCSLSVIIKLKLIFSVDQLLRLCLGSTLLLLLPSCMSLLLRPSPTKFRLALVNTSLVFFLFSFQVHEKSILLAALPVCTLLPERALACMWFLLISTFSMLPLLIKDELVLPSVVSCLLFCIIISLVKEVVPSLQTPISSTGVKLLFGLSMAGCMGLTLASLLVPPPPNLPDLFPLLVSIYSCLHFLLFAVYFHWLQFTWVDAKVLQPRVQFAKSSKKRR